MILILGFAVASLTLFILYLIKGCFKKHKKGLKRILIVVSLISILLTSISLFNYVTCNVQKTEDTMEYNVLYYQKNNTYSINCRDIIKYNKKVYRYKIYGRWIVTDWLFYPGCDTLNYIMIKGNINTIEPDKTFEGII